MLPQVYVSGAADPVGAKLAREEAGPAGQKFRRVTTMLPQVYASGAADSVGAKLAREEAGPAGQKFRRVTTMLQVDTLHQYYGGSHILRGLSFEVKVGEVTCLLGRNGVGKTTLLKCLMGLIPAKDGSVNWEGKAITGFKPHQRVHAGIAYVPQGREIFGRLTVEENLLMGLSRFPGSEAKEVPAFIYELFPVLLQMKHRRGGDLSGGQQQQLAIGRALASRPRLLILDEPTEGIQPSVIKEIGAVIKKLAAKGDMAILLVEQFYDFAAELADQYLVMSRGEIVQQGRGENMEAEGVRGLVTI